MSLRPACAGIGTAISLLASAGCATVHPDQRSGQALVVSSSEQGELALEVTDATVVIKDGQRVSAAQLAPGEAVRATYRIVGDRAQALRIEATRGDSIPRQNPSMMQVVPGDQAAPDDREEPVRSEHDDFALQPDMH
jgi:hypothetical protein